MRCFMQEVMKEIGEGIIGCALEETGPRVQQGLGDLAVMASFAKPLRELLFGESVNVLRLFDVFEVQTVRDVILGKISSISSAVRVSKPL